MLFLNGHETYKKDVQSTIHGERNTKKGLRGEIRKEL